MHVRACKCTRRPVGISGLRCTHRNVHGHLRRRHIDTGVHKGKAASMIKLVYLQGRKQVSSQQKQRGDKYIFMAKLNWKVQSLKGIIKLERHRKATMSKCRALKRAPAGV